MGAVERAAEIAAMSKRDQKKAIAAAVAAGEEAVLAALPEPLALAGLGKLEAITDIGAVVFQAAITSGDKKRLGAALRALGGGPTHPALLPLLLGNLSQKAARLALTSYGEAALAAVSAVAAGDDAAAAADAVKALGALGASGMSVLAPVMAAMQHEVPRVRNAATLAIEELTEDITPAVPLLRAGLLSGTKAYRAIEKHPCSIFLAVVLPVLVDADREQATDMAGKLRLLTSVRCPAEALRPLLALGCAHEDISRDVFDFLAEAEALIPGAGAEVYHRDHTAALAARYPAAQILPLVRAELSDPTTPIARIQHCAWVAKRYGRAAAPLAPLLREQIATPRRFEDRHDRHSHFYTLEAALSAMVTLESERRQLYSLLITHGDRSVASAAKKAMVRYRLPEVPGRWEATTFHAALQEQLDRLGITWQPVDLYAPRRTPHPMRFNTADGHWMLADFEASTGTTPGFAAWCVVRGLVWPQELWRMKRGEYDDDHIIDATSSANVGWDQYIQGRRRVLMPIARTDTDFFWCVDLLDQSTDPMMFCADHGTGEGLGYPYRFSGWLKQLTPEAG